MEGECSPAASLAALASLVYFTSAHVRTPQGEGLFLLWDVYPRKPPSPLYCPQEREERAAGFAD